MKYDKIYQFRIQLRNIKPPIWRVIQVPDTYTFWELHVAIQDAMGWFDSHLHEFVVKRGRHELLIGVPDDDFPSGRETLPGHEVAIRDYFKKPGARALYMYDFGDGWEHDIKLEAIEPRPGRKRYPKCIGGARACPPEDCGGPWGYQELLGVLSDPSNDEFTTMKEWVGEHFEPESFRAKDVRFDNPAERWRFAFGH